LTAELPTDLRLFAIIVLAIIGTVVLIGMLAWNDRRS
jgi:hypothetical protein